MTARFLSLRPSRPEVQRRRNEAVCVAHEVRARKRVMRLASRKAAVAAEMKPADHAGFARWYEGIVHSGLLAGLSEEEEMRVREVAWKAFHGDVKHTALWSSTLRALHALQREAGDAVNSRRRQEAARYRSEGGKPRGW